MGSHSHPSGMPRKIREGRGPTGSDVTRRRFLHITGGTLALATMGSMLHWIPGKTSSAAPMPLLNHRRMVIVNFRGGNDGLNMVVPQAVQRYYDRRTGISIAPSGSGAGSALALTGAPDYGLHPSLTNIQGLFNDGDVGIVNAVGYPDANLSHFVSEDIWSYGVRDAWVGLGIPAFSGWISRFADLYANTPMGVVSVGQGNLKDFQGGRTATPLQMQSLDRFEFDLDNNHRANHEYRLEIAKGIVQNHGRAGLTGDVVNAQNQAFDLSGQIQTALAGYEVDMVANAANYQFPGTTNTPRIAARMRDVSTLIYGGFETRMFYTGFGGFDTHGGQAARHGDLMREFDIAIGGLASDLKTMGVWDDTVIVVISEFGRRNYVNGSQGTDHGHGNCMMLIGGGVNGGVFGPDITTEMLDREYLGYEVDFRTVYQQLLENHLQVDAGPLFPETREKFTSPGTLV